MSKIIDAVSIVMTCGNEIFAIQRQNYLKAFPGYWAFPGGKVEEKDEDFSLEHKLTQRIDHRLFGAAVREGQEELGIDLREEIKSGRVRSIDFLGLAITPDFNPYRFATYFFKIDFTDKVDFVVDENEAQFSEWMSAETLLKLYDSGSLMAVPPVVKVIEVLGKDPFTKSIPDLNFDYDSSKYAPYIETIRGVKQIMPLSNTLPPAVRTNAFAIGEKDERVIIDPSPRDDEEYEKFKNTLALFGADKIVLTHQHPDHYERSNRLARELNIPIHLSAYTKMRIERKSPGYFEGITTVLLKEGDVITHWLGHKVITMEIPGHDEGQLGFYPENKLWFIAGDLFQGIGTVVVGGEEGDMEKYFHTLKRIIALGPKAVYPSHGIPLGGTNILEATLKHREAREAEVLKLHQEGLSPEEMLEKIYANVKKELWPYALENINQHLKKLKNEKKI